MLTITYYTISLIFILPLGADKCKHKGKKI